MDFRPNNTTIFIEVPKIEKKFRGVEESDNSKIDSPNYSLRAGIMNVVNHQS